MTQLTMQQNNSIHSQSCYRLTSLLNMVAAAAIILTSVSSYRIIALKPYRTFVENRAGGSLAHVKYAKRTCHASLPGTWLTSTFKFLFLYSFLVTVAGRDYFITAFLLV
jgi:hypothetical protein